MDDEYDGPRNPPEIDKLNALARLVGTYRKALADQGLSDDLADQLIQDWHLNRLSNDPELLLMSRAMYKQRTT